MIEKDVSNDELMQSKYFGQYHFRNIKWSVYGTGKACEYLCGYGLYNQRYFGAFDG